MQTGGRVQDHVARRKFYRLCTVGVLYNELTPVIVLRTGEKKRSRKIGADSLARRPFLPDCIVNVGPEGLAAVVAVEQRGKYAQGQCSPMNSGFLSSAETICSLN